MLQCPKKWKNRRWLKNKLLLHQCKTPLKSVIYGDFGTCHNKKLNGRLVETYITSTWDARRKNEVPPVSELDNLFEFLGKGERFNNCEAN